MNLKDTLIREDFRNFFFSQKKIVNKIPKNILLAVFLCFVSLLLLKSTENRSNQRILGLQSTVKSDQQEALKWEQILKERPDYRDGWIQLAAIYYQLGDKQKSKEAILKAKSIDPNNKTVLSFEKFLEN